MTQELGMGIAHLDFPVEEKAPEKEPRHFAHPIDKDKYWCGKPANGTWTFTSQQGLRPRPVSEIACVGCLHEYIAKGSDWWWNVHNAYYQSSCRYDLGHNCGQ